MKGIVRHRPACWAPCPKRVGEERGQVTRPGSSPWLRGWAGWASSEGTHYISPLCIQLTCAYRPSPVCWALLRMTGWSPEIDKSPAPGSWRSAVPSVLFCAHLCLLFPFTSASFSVDASWLASVCWHRVYVRGGVVNTHSDFVRWYFQSALRQDSSHESGFET